MSEINKSRIRETEKLIDILDDLLREVNITEQLSRSPRNPDDSSAHTGESQQPNNLPPHLISDSPFQDSDEGSFDDLVSSSTSGIGRSQRLEKADNQSGKPLVDTAVLSAQDTPVSNEAGKLEREERGGVEEEE